MMRKFRELAKVVVIFVMSMYRFQFVAMQSCTNEEIGTTYLRKYGFINLNTNEEGKSLCHSTCTDK